MPTGPFFDAHLRRQPDDPGATPKGNDMEQKTTAAKAIVASLGGVLGSTAVTAAPVLPADAPWWAYLIVWAVPQVIAALVYYIPNKPA